MRLDLPMGEVSKSLRIYHSLCFILFHKVLSYFCIFADHSFVSGIFLKGDPNVKMGIVFFFLHVTL